MNQQTLNFVPIEYLKNFSIQQLLYSNETVSIHSVQKKQENSNSFGPMRALKIIKLNPNDIVFLNRYHKYYTMQMNVSNSHVVKVYETFFVHRETFLECWIIMDYCELQSLEKFFKKEPIINEIMKKCFISDISVGLEYIYFTIGLHHFYLCPENILLEKDLSSVCPKVKINNLGLMDTIGGMRGIGIQEYNIHFQPPEFVQNSPYDNSDVWSFGMLIYYIMTGYTIYSVLQMDYQTVCQMQPEIPFDLIEDKQCVDLLKRMLVYNPQNRITLYEVLKHPFITDCVQKKYTIRGDIKNYHFVKYLGSGSYGDVVLAMNANGDYVAIKEIMYDPNNPSAVGTLQREVFLRHCKHPNIVEFKDYCESEYSFIGQIDTNLLPRSTSKEMQMIAKVNSRKYLKGNFYFLVMEYCDSEYTDLEKYIQAKGPLPTNDILLFLGDLSYGLYYLHYHRGIVHRDLKPENLMLKSNGPFNLPTIKIADLGLARMFTNDMKTNAGTPLYQCPEIIRANMTSYSNQTRKYSSKCDLYSVGVILYYMATKTYPFTDDPYSSRGINMFFNNIRNFAEWDVPYDIEIDNDLYDLLQKLITHYEKDRISWKEFFEHPFVQRALVTKMYSMRTEVQNEDMLLSSMEEI